MEADDEADTAAAADLGSSTTTSKMANDNHCWVEAWVEHDASGPAGALHLQPVATANDCGHDVANDAISTGSSIQHRRHHRVWGWAPTGAAEPAPVGDIWFAALAARAYAGERRHMIYAASPRVGGARLGASPVLTSFSLAWAPHDRSVAALDRTAWYAAPRRILRLSLVGRRGARHPRRDGAATAATPDGSGSDAGDERSGDQVCTRPVERETRDERRGRAPISRDDSDLVASALYHPAARWAAVLALIVPCAVYHTPPPRTARCSTCASSAPRHSTAASLGSSPRYDEIHNVCCVRATITAHFALLLTRVVIRHRLGSNRGACAHAVAPESTLDGFSARRDRDPGAAPLVAFVELAPVAPVVEAAEDDVDGPSIDRGGGGGSGDDDDAFDDDSAAETTTVLSLALPIGRSYLIEWRQRRRGGGGDDEGQLLASALCNLLPTRRCERLATDNEEDGEKENGAMEYMTTAAGTPRVTTTRMAACELELTCDKPAPGTWKAGPSKDTPKPLKQ
jgi:hypothetical protein